MKNNDNIIEPIFNIFWEGGAAALRIGRRAMGIKTEKEKAMEIAEYQKKINEEKEARIEVQNKLKVGNKTYDFNELFFNCNLSNKLKDMPILEKYSNMNTVDIYSFKLPTGVTVSAIRDKIEHISDFFEVEQMNIKIQKKNNMMDIIVTTDNLFSDDKVIKYYVPKLDKNRLMMPLGHFINKDYLEEFLAIDMSSGNVPHALIASTTGGGKSNFVRSVLLSWIMNYSPKELEMYIMDSQGGADYTTLLYAPHVIDNMCYTEVSDVKSILDGCLNEVKSRNAKLIKEEVVNCVEYREKGLSMPHKVILIDEYASFEDTKKNGESSIQDKVNIIAANGRKVGVHVIIVTQDANKDSIDPTIKRNLPLKIGFKADNEQHSKNICNVSGLETLKSKGVGRAYGLPIDDDYVQFRAMLAPGSSQVKQIIKDKYRL